MPVESLCCVGGEQDGRKVLVRVLRCALQAGRYWSSRGCRVHQRAVTPRHRGRQQVRGESWEAGPGPPACSREGGGEQSLLPCL